MKNKHTGITEMPKDIKNLKLNSSDLI